MVLTHSASAVHYIIYVVVKCARVQLYELLSSETFSGTRYVSLQPTLLSKILKK